MGHKPCDFKGSNVKRAIKAVESAGIDIGRIEIEGGKITIVPAGDEEVADDSNNSFAKLMRSK